MSIKILTLDNCFLENWKRNYTYIITLKFYLRCDDDETINIDGAFAPCPQRMLE
jgi:hypothetical protein